MAASVVEKIYEHSFAAGNKTAIIADKGAVTYSELWEKIKQFYVGLRRRGLKAGDCVVVQTEHTSFFVFALFAVHLSGAIFVPVNQSASNGYYQELIKTTGAKLIIARNKIDVDAETVFYDQLADIGCTSDSDVPRLPTGDQSADLVFTTGTTGKAKGVEIQHSALHAGVENIIVGYWTEEDIKYLLYGPFNHTFTLRRLYSLMYTGNTAVLMDGLTDIKCFFDMLDEHGINATHMQPSAIRMFLKLMKRKLSEYSGQFKFIETGTAPCPEVDKEQMCQLFPNTRLSFGYGCSESDAVARYNYSQYKGKASCVGKPTANAKILIVDENRKIIESSHDNCGLIACKGPMNMKGYWKEPELTDEVMRDGILYTKDIGYFDGEGFLYVIGRVGDVINIGGIKVAAKEIEDRVLFFPGIADCACIAVDDELSGQAPKLFVVMDDNECFSPGKLKAFLAEVLEPYKLPKHIVQRRDLPKTYNGKIQKNNLK